MTSYDHKSHRTIVMRRITLFIEGASRASLLAFGPILAGRLIHGISDPLFADRNLVKEHRALRDTQYWPSVAWCTAELTAAFLLGHAIGATIGQHSSWAQQKFIDAKTNAFSRVVGVLVALHFFSFGSGLTSLTSLLLIRFASGVLVGMIHRVVCLRTHQLKKGHIESDYKDERNVEDGNIGDQHNQKQDQDSDHLAPHLDFEAGTCKVWLTGFAISIFSGGLLYHLFRRSIIYTSLTGGYPWTLSPSFFVAVVFGTDFALRCLMLSDGGHTTEGCDAKKESEVQEITAELLDGRAKRRNLSKSTNEGRNRFILNTTAQLNDSLDQDKSYWNRVRFDSSINNSIEGNRVRLGSHMSADGNRSRVDSNMSNDIFFDCTSEYGDSIEQTSFDHNDGFYGEDVPLSLNNSSDGNFIDLAPRDNTNSIARYVDGKCVFDDGSPACVPAGESPGNPSTAFVKTFKGKSASRWEEMKQWRIRSDIWRIHSMHQPFFSKIKEAYPHIIHGHTKDGYPVVYEKPGKMNLKGLFQTDCTIKDMARHNTFLMEYFANVLSNRPELREMLQKRTGKDAVCSWGFCVVMDITGASPSTLSGDVLRYVKLTGETNDANYPMSLQQVKLINSPFWISSLFGAIKSVLPESVNVDVLSSRKTTEGLRILIDDDQIPPEYGGTSSYSLGDHPYEQELLDFVSEINANEANSDKVIGGLEIKFGDELQTVFRENKNLKTPKTEFDKEPTHSGGHIERSLTSSNENDIESGNKGVSMMFSLGDCRSDATPVPTSRQLSAVEEKNIPRISTMAHFYHHTDNHKEGHLDELMFVIVTAMHGAWCAVQGSLETALPLWLMSPPILGGLGYEPARIGASLFSTSIVLMWISKTNFFHVASRIPLTAPMRGYRIGVGSMAVLLTLLPFVPAFSTSVIKKDNMIVMTCNILVGASILIANFLGRSSSSILHQVASSSYVEKLSLQCESITVTGRFINKTVRFIKSGHFTFALGVFGETLGALCVAPIFAWSTDQRRPFPLDGALCFYTGALACAALYVLSFSLYVNFVGECIPKSTNHNGTSNTKKISKRCALLGEVCAVSLSDMASLFGEENWTSWSALRHDRPDILADHTFSMKDI